MKAKVISMEVVTFKDGNKSNKICAVSEKGHVGIFYSVADCKIGDEFNLEIGTDNNNKFIVRKELIV